MGESIGGARLQFNGSLRVEAREERLSGEGGALFLREIDERLGLSEPLAKRLHDPRDPDKITHPLVELLRTSLLLLSQGWQDQDDADALRNDPVLRLAVSTRRGLAPLLSPEPSEAEAVAGEKPRVPDGLASQPSLSRLVGMLASDDNRRFLREALLDFTARRILAERGGHRFSHLTIDVDSVGLLVYGEQGRFNPHLGGTAYHPLVASVASTGDILDAELRDGTSHTAAGAIPFLLDLADRAEGTLCQEVSFRFDAGFPSEPLMAALEARGDRGTKYVARVRNNAVLDRMAEPYLRHPPGRRPDHPREWHYEMTYKAKDWSIPRRVVLVVIERPGQLWLDHFWLITSWTAEEKDGPTLLDLYRERGTAEGHQGEWKDVLEPRLSSMNRMKDHYKGKEPKQEYRLGHPFEQNEAIMLLNALAYNLMHAGRRLLERATRQGWSLRRLRERVLRVAVRVLAHANRAVIVVAREAARWWESLWTKLGRLRPAYG